MGSKMPKVEEKLGEDRISQMPDEILLHILSLLDDTFLAVQTTILSKRWNNLWVSISSLRFAYDRFEECDDRFMTFVDRVVSLHDSADIRKFYLHYHNEGSREYMLVDDYTRIQTCISTVIERNVVEFYLTLYNTFNFTPEVPFLFPESLFMCNTLVVLKLHCSNWHSFSNIPIDACLPRLKVLDIFVDDPDEPNFPYNLVTSCPVLEDLTISGTLLDLHINISAPELKTLRMYMSASYGLYSINAPKLETFDLSDDMLRLNKYLFENGRSLINVKLELKLDIDGSPFGGADDAIALFAKFSNVEYLCFDVRSFNLRDLNDFCLPDFVNLSQLVLVLYGFNYWKFLIECLKRSPNLKHLVLEKKWHYGQDELEWNFFDPPELPGCLVSHLQTISVKGFEGQRDEMEVVEFMLKNGQVLNTVSIHTVSMGLMYKKEKLYKKLLTYKKGSGSCVILAD